MALEWGLTALLVKIISLVRGRNKSGYFNNKRDEVVFTLAEKLNDAPFFLLTQAYTTGQPMEEISPEMAAKKIPYIKFNRIGSKEYDLALKPVYFSKRVFLDENLFYWQDLLNISNNIYLPADLKNAIINLNFTDGNTPDLTSDNFPTNHVRIALLPPTKESKWYELPEPVCKNFEDYYQRLSTLRKALIKASRGKLKLN